MAITPRIAHKPERAALNNEYGDILRSGPLAWLGVAWSVSAAVLRGKGRKGIARWYDKSMV
ncbi:hypothetical protein E2C01_079400 [Portunus trituberculatus]|uniref:Uncharacterized protein n=1 Tax=Portunus trituberculatus TaxID=210409 RepID=A0A5B7IQ83_PORTR|nr:hypothetical protein [Portunus trituberculatus]